MLQRVRRNQDRQRPSSAEGEAMNKCRRRKQRARARYHREERFRRMIEIYSAVQGIEISFWFAERVSDLSHLQCGLPVIFHAEWPSW